MLLPTSLKHEPLIDVVFEMRFGPIENRPALADVLPGLIFHKLGSTAKLSRFPQADIPLSLRDQDPNLHYAPLVRIESDTHLISVGDRVLIVNCKLPYPKWKGFRERIFEVLGWISELKLNLTVTRYSLKYVDLIESNSLVEQMSKIKLGVSVGSVEATNHQLNLELHQRCDDQMHIQKIMLGVSVTLLDQTTKQGAIIDVDSIANVQATELSTLVETFAGDLDSLRRKNKELFFDCLQQETIESFEPTYE